MLGTDVVSTLYNVENMTSDFLSFSTWDQRYFHVDPQRWKNVDPTLKCWLGRYLGLMFNNADVTKTSSKKL